ncbi:ATP-dependent RNA helicase DeaD [Nakamurella panacisegetis]|uniref:RNA helicase n=1 Tax=Nakamurella panacisegetis TaxID=1090615 RepID=A0A1H0QWB6_9ACTN|nr:DEAD/DEAH box helicase [Nakamurella panacisegetis]SDP21582.1 ATP-dependent RNA helicase DeaD [Nakamurella panacisegetis]
MAPLAAPTAPTTTSESILNGDAAFQDADLHTESALVDNLDEYEEEVPAFGFDALNLPDSLIRAVTKLGFTTPSEIQEQAIPALLAGRDITGVAQTGTGKTAAFGLPLLAAIDPALRQVQALVLTPTRELAMQVAEAIGSFAEFMPRVTVVPVYGGSSFLPQKAALKNGAQVVVGTPGRIIDHLERGTLDLTGIRYMVLDEADEMLRMGFAEDVDRILQDAPKDRQTALFSATMPSAIRNVANRHMNSPVDITVAKKAGNTVSIRQTYAVVPFREKVDALARILQVSEGDATIVFVRTKGACDEVGAELIARGVSAAAINGDVPQKERERIIERLRSGKLDVLVATDVAARGLDVDRIDLVVNFDAPGEVESYTHRIGRTGRAGRTGEALTFFTPREMSRLRLIERYTRTTLEQVTPPSQADVAAHKATKVLEQATARLAIGRLEHYRQAVATYLAQEDLTAAELAATLLALAAGDDGVVAPKQSQASFAADRPERGGEYSARRGEFGREDRFSRDGDRAATNRPDRPRKPNATPAGPRYRVAVGHAHGVRPAGIVGAITAEGGLAGRDLGRIDIFDTYSLVEIGGHISPAAFGRISAAKVSGQSLKIQLDTSPHTGGASSGPRRSGPGNERPARAGHRTAR